MTSQSKSLERLGEWAHEFAGSLGKNPESSISPASYILAYVGELRRVADRYAWLTDDHEDPEVRRDRNELLERMAVMSRSAIDMHIDSRLGKIDEIPDPGP